MEALAALMFAGVLVLVGYAERQSMGHDQARLAEAETRSDRFYEQVVLWRARWLAPTFIALGVLIAAVTVAGAMF